MWWFSDSSRRWLYGKDRDTPIAYCAQNSFGWYGVGLIASQGGFKTLRAAKAFVERDCKPAKKPRSTHPKADR